MLIFLLSLTSKSCFYVLAMICAYMSMSQAGPENEETLSWIVLTIKKWWRDHVSCVLSCDWWSWVETVLTLGVLALWGKILANFRNFEIWPSDGDGFTLRISHWRLSKWRMCPCPTLLSYYPYYLNANGMLCHFSHLRFVIQSYSAPPIYPSGLKS